MEKRPELELALVEYVPLLHQMIWFKLRFVTKEIVSFIKNIFFFKKSSCIILNNILKRSCNVNMDKLVGDARGVHVFTLWKMWQNKSLYYTPAILWGVWNTVQSWVRSSQVRTSQVDIFLDQRLFGPRIFLDPKFWLS